MLSAPTSLLTTLEPIAALSPGRIQELASMCMVEGLNPFRMNVVQSEQSLYLLQGNLKLNYADGPVEVLHGGTDVTRHPIVSDQAFFRALPPANVEEMFWRMERVPVKSGQVIIRQGDEGDYYYLIESGAADVLRSNNAGG